MMAYFSNSTEGSALDEQCLDCFHGYDEKGELAPCPVLLLQLNWNYEQLERTHYPDGEFTPEAVIKKEALDVLIPTTREGNVIGAECKMFVKRGRVHA